jgi:predicted ABC-type ATPase
MPSPRMMGRGAITTTETTMSERFILKKGKAKAADADGALTGHGMQVAHDYARSWRVGDRATNMEQQYPELVDLFYDIRNDEDVAAEHAMDLEKAVYYGPRGGKWADAAHTIPYAAGKEGSKISGVMSFDSPKQHAATYQRFAMAVSAGRGDLDVLSELTPDEKKIIRERGWISDHAVTDKGKRMAARFTPFIEAQKIIGTDEDVIPPMERDPVAFAKEYVKKREAKKAMSKSEGIIEVYVLPEEMFKSGPYIGPRGGMWADPKHTIPYRGKHDRRQKKAERKKTKRGSRKAWKEHYRDANYMTINEYRISEGKGDKPPVYKPERAMLHEEIVDSFLTKSDGSRIKPPPPGVQKTAIVLMGGPASGKTSIVKGLLNTNSIADAGFVNVNPDDCKERLPEYDDGLAQRARDTAWVCHEESSDLSSAVYNRALAEGLNVVVDGTGKTLRNHAAKIKKLQEMGYHVKLVMPDIDVEDAIRRSMGRAEATGRYVPMKVMIPAHMQIPQNFEPLARMADEAHLFDNRGPFGTPAQLRWSIRKGEEDVVHDPAFVEKFKRRAPKLAEEVSRRKEEFKRMNKSDDGTRPALSMEEMMENIKQSAGKIKPEGTPGKYPGAGKDGNGIEWPVEDTDFNSYDPRESLKDK